ncbi:MAG: hypothetical protein RL380_1056 [Verrucomicrobiota bacterium]|jgi:hypothetical protein
MADNSIPEGYDPVVQHLEDAADGANTHGATIGLLHNTEAAIRVDLYALVGRPGGPGGAPPPIPGAKAVWNTAQANKSAATAALRNLCSNHRAFARTCVRSLFPLLGDEWNAAWNAAGFTGGSLAIPTNPLTLFQQLRAYYGNNPTHECTVQGVACTAAACEAAAQAISTAQSASNQTNTDSGLAQANYYAALKAGRDRLMNLNRELTQVIPADDDRWYAFGFEKPSDPHTPSVPENLTLVAGAAGSKMVISDWDDARRADSYRLRAVVKATGVEVVNHITPDNQVPVTVDSQPSGTVLTFTVTARNSAGESGPSAPVDFALP